MLLFGTYGGGEPEKTRLKLVSVFLSCASPSLSSLLRLHAHTQPHANNARTTDSAACRTRVRRETREGVGLVAVLTVQNEKNSSGNFFTKKNTFFLVNKDNRLVINVYYLHFIAVRDGNDVIRVIGAPN